MREPDMRLDKEKMKPLPAIKSTGLTLTHPGQVPNNPYRIPSSRQQVDIVHAVSFDPKRFTWV